jgi:hypothetical protein
MLVSLIKPLSICYQSSSFKNYLKIIVRSVWNLIPDQGILIEGEGSVQLTSFREY